MRLRVFNDDRIVRGAEASLSRESNVQQRQYDAADRTDQWLQIMSPAGEDGLDLRQDARVLVARLTPDHRLAHSFGEGRGFGADSGANGCTVSAAVPGVGVVGEVREEGRMWV